MLVLERGKGESIVLVTPEGKISVKVLEIRRHAQGGHYVKLGTEAPRTVPVHRQEVHELIQRGK